MAFASETPHWHWSMETAALNVDYGAKQRAVIKQWARIGLAAHGLDMGTSCKLHYRVKSAACGHIAANPNFVLLTDWICMSAL